MSESSESTGPTPPKRREPTGQKPLDYNDTLRGRSIITEFADPCELARRVRSRPSSRGSAETGWLD